MRKAQLVLYVSALVVVACYITATQPPSFKKWAQKAPLETVVLKAGQTSEEKIKERVSANMRAADDMTGVVAIIGQRQGRKIGTMEAGVEFKLPVPYSEWHE